MINTPTLVTVTHRDAAASDCSCLFLWPQAILYDAITQGFSDVQTEWWSVLYNLLSLLKLHLYCVTCFNLNEHVRLTFRLNNTRACSFQIEPTRVTVAFKLNQHAWLWLFNWMNPRDCGFLEPTLLKSLWRCVSIGILHAETLKSSSEFL